MFPNQNTLTEPNDSLTSAAPKKDVDLEPDDLASKENRRKKDKKTLFIATLAGAFAGGVIGTAHPEKPSLQLPPNAGFLEPVRPQADISEAIIAVGTGEGHLQNDGSLQLEYDRKNTSFEMKSHFHIVPESQSMLARVWPRETPLEEEERYLTRDVFKFNHRSPEAYAALQNAWENMVAEANKQEHVRIVGFTQYPQDALRGQALVPPAFRNIHVEGATLEQARSAAEALRYLANKDHCAVETISFSTIITPTTPGEEQMISITSMLKEDKIIEANVDEIANTFGIMLVIVVFGIGSYADAQRQQRKATKLAKKSS